MDEPVSGRRRLGPWGVVALLCALILIVLSRSLCCRRSCHAEPAHAVLPVATPPAQPLPPAAPAAPAPVAAAEAPPPPPATAPAPASPVMPIEPQSLESFQVANSRAAADLVAREPTLSPHVLNARAIRDALASMGYDPDQTLLQWMTAPPQGDLDTRRTIDSFLAVALGDSGNSDDFTAILSRCSPALQTAARSRRAQMGR